MRYLCIQYVKKPSGQMDESISLTNRIKTRDIQMNAVIIDFADRKILKASLGGVSIPKEFDRIVAFYHQHYQHVIDRLLKENGLTKVENNPVTPSADTATAAG
nr:hypothetical protein [Oxalobacteraceae bacterium]